MKIDIFADRYDIMTTESGDIEGKRAERLAVCNRNGGTIARDETDFSRNRGIVLPSCFYERFDPRLTNIPRRMHFSAACRKRTEASRVVPSRKFPTSFTDRREKDLYRKYRRAL